jgi:hypothetical protein
MVVFLVVVSNVGLLNGCFLQVKSLMTLARKGCKKSGIKKKVGGTGTSSNGRREFEAKYGRI